MRLERKASPFISWSVEREASLYARGGQTCSMHEPHIVKPKLQNAAR